MAAAMARELGLVDAPDEVEDLDDEALLGRFLEERDLDSEEAFRVLVQRHGPMVLGVCRHVLGRRHDAEDAFQATFLALARKGRSIRDPKVLAGWLHEVAYRIAIKVRAGTARRRDVERQCVAMIPRSFEMNRQDEEAAWDELRPVLHEEVDRLPEKYRLPVILSYLEGKTNEEVANQLRWPVGTVKGRLSRARELLRSRLARRGLALAAALLLRSLSRGHVFAEEMPAVLVRRTVRTAVRLGPGPCATDVLAAHEALDPTSDDLLDLADLWGSPAPRRRGLLLPMPFPPGALLAVAATFLVAVVVAMAAPTVLGPAWDPGFGAFFTSLREAWTPRSACVHLPASRPSAGPETGSEAGRSASDSDLSECSTDTFGASNGRKHGGR